MFRCFARFRRKRHGALGIALVALGLLLILLSVPFWALTALFGAGLTIAGVLYFTRR